MEKTFKIIVQEGLHARPCTLVVNAATPFSSNIEIIHNDRAVNLKSIISVMALGIKADTVVTIRTEGDDAEQAMEKITDILTQENIATEV